LRGPWLNGLRANQFHSGAWRDLARHAIPAVSRRGTTSCDQDYLGMDAFTRARHYEKIAARCQELAKLAQLRVGDIYQVRHMHAWPRRLLARTNAARIATRERVLSENVKVLAADGACSQSRQRHPYFLACR
jgi:hypothetical protein